MPEHEFVTLKGFERPALGPDSAGRVAVCCKRATGVPGKSAHFAVKVARFRTDLRNPQKLG